MTIFNESIDIQNQYLNDAAKFHLLSKKEELALGKLISQGQKAQALLDSTDVNGFSNENISELRVQVEAASTAKKQLVECNLRLVASFAQKALGNGLSYLDLIQEGNIGLMTAADKFDYRRGNRFATYASYWIKQAISRAIQKHGRTIHLPIHMVEKIRKLNNITKSLKLETGRTPSDAQLAYEMGSSVEEIQKLKIYSVSIGSLNIPIDKDAGSGTEIADQVKDEGLIPAEDVLENSVIVDTLFTMLNDLTEQERAIVVKRFGIGCDVVTLEKLGNEFGVSRERIRQILNKALKKLRKASKDSGLSDI